MNPITIDRNPVSGFYTASMILSGYRIFVRYDHKPTYGEALHDLTLRKKELSK